MTHPQYFYTTGSSRNTFYPLYITHPQSLHMTYPQTPVNNTTHDTNSHNCVHCTLHSVQYTCTTLILKDSTWLYQTLLASSCELRITAPKLSIGEIYVIWFAVYKKNSKDFEYLLGGKNSKFLHLLLEATLES